MVVPAVQDDLGVLVRDETLGGRDDVGRRHVTRARQVMLAEVGFRKHLEQEEFLARVELSLQLGAVDRVSRCA
jgi:hypothetical protein